LSDKRRNAVLAHINRLRSEEIYLIRHLLKKEQIVLELGGGNGWQAREMSNLGCVVSSIDLENRRNSSLYFDVQSYDGIQIPFENETVEVFFSSNVLEHIRDIDNILKELHRVLKPDGYGIVILPSVAWRFWTLVTYYVYSVFLALKTPFRSKLKFESWHKLSIVAPAHGEYASSFHELYYYQRTQWAGKFVRHDFKILQVINVQTFYTGYVLFPNLSVEIRKKLARVFGGATNIFILSRN